jgi:hypothetical protein
MRRPLLLCELPQGDPGPLSHSLSQRGRDKEGDLFCFVTLSLLSSNLERETAFLIKGATGMEVQFEPDVQAKLEQMARESGRAAAELVKDAVAGYVHEVAGTSQILNSRYDDIKSGKVKLVSGDDVFARLREKSEAHRAKPGS